MLPIIMTNISKIDNNGNIQYLSSANIEITSAQKYEIDLKFQNISCADEGHYILVMKSTTSVHMLPIMKCTTSVHMLPIMKCTTSVHMLPIMYQ
jgi:hypothetical protein